MKKPARSFPAGLPGISADSDALRFEQLTVRRIYDREADAFMYVSFSRKPVDGSAKMSLSTVPLWEEDVTWKGREKPVVE